MSKVTQLPVKAPVPEVPTLEQLVQQRTNLVLQRGNAKEQIEQCDRALGVVAGMISIHESYKPKEEVVED